METGASAQVDNERIRMRMRTGMRMRMRMRMGVGMIMALLTGDSSKVAAGIRSLGRHTSMMASDTQVSRRVSGSHHE